MDKTSDIKSPLLQMIDFLNAGDVDSAMELISPDFEGVEFPIGEPIRGREGVRAEVAGWSGLDGPQEITNIIDTGAQIVLEGVFSGTHAGPITLGKETFPATGGHIKFRFCTIGTIRDGLVAGERHYYNMEELRAQLLGR